jgi:hypothetical protein
MSKRRCLEIKRTKILLENANISWDCRFQKIACLLEGTPAELKRPMIARNVFFVF